MTPDAPGNAAGNPIEIKLRRAARLLEVTFEGGSRFELPFEYLRVYSPSAEVKGHGPGQETLVLGKETVGVRAIEPVGQYAVKLVFDDGHDTGLYTWKYLYELGRDREQNWSRYLARVQALKPSWQK
ncbi:MAG: gamma-butyrobetaine hydroxylase-like domain-containing protein [Steroidobacterales bacterium]